MKDYRRVQRTIGILKNGVFEDSPVYQFGSTWYYEGFGFERPECKKVKALLK